MEYRRPLLLDILLLASLISPASNEDLENLLRMAGDFQDFMNVHYRATIMLPRDLPKAWLHEELLLPGGVIASESPSEVVDSLTSLEVAQTPFILVFLDSELASRTLTMLQEKADIFASQGVLMVRGGTELAKLKLRLDTHLYLYNVTGKTISIKEIYSVRDIPRISRHLGNWSADAGLYIAEPNIWERRKDLMGATIRNGLLPWSVFNSYTTDENNQITSNVGVYATTMTRMAFKLNFTEVLMESKDKKWGGLNSDGKTWNGLVRMLLDDEIDLCTAGLTQFQERAEAVDFTVPLQEEGMTLIAKTNQGQSTQFWVYLEIFPIHVWIVILAMLFALAVGLYVISRIGGRRFHSANDSEMFTFLSSLAASGLLVLQMNYNLVLENVSAKALFMFANFLAYLIYTYYTCDLTARMTSGTPPSVIR